MGNVYNNPTHSIECIMTGYYDYVLGLIPAVLIGITAVLTLVGLSTPFAVSVGAIIAVGLMGHAMFVKGPVVDVGAPTNHTDGANGTHPGTGTSD
ncbi:hypothetical protein SAMN06264855_10445 [Halorubrum vacuolatum]|uniref:Uncharacterized protein n=2 Tax=Halorubrum vacuolatum TaxID=63740 RepID=A0A238VTB9_HALVU|nr:hypothetical protein SAMN06264855_10445 [Halorubrum vacuolatum]